MTGKKVLIAEDEPSIALSLEFLLHGAGYEVTIAQDGDEALRMAAQVKPDLIVLDIMLPIMNGFEVCRRVRKNGDLGGVKILVLTARGRRSEAEKTLALGADAYMTKPFATRELVKRIDELFASSAK